MVDAYEGCDVAIFYVLGEYLNIDMPDEKYVRLNMEDKFVDIMCNVNPYHIPNIQYENEENVLYLRIIKALY